MIGPVFEELSTKYGAITFLKVRLPPTACICGHPHPWVARAT
jgi:hypothetical protein